MSRQIKTSNISTGAITSSVIDDTGVTAGTYGSSTNVPVITVNAKGQLTTVTTAALPAGLATETYVNSAITSAVDALINSAPGALDTLNELASALGDDPNFASTVTNELASKASIGQLNFVESSMQVLMETRLPAGVIVMWSGSVATIPTGWLLCNGTNNTPNLQDRFIVGAGSTYSVDGTGGSANATLPQHSHTASGTTSTGGTHRHGGYSNQNLFYAGGGGRANDAPNGYATSGRYWETLDNGSHNHSFSATTSTEGSSATNANLPPYYALAYIMKA